MPKYIKEEKETVKVKSGNKKNKPYVIEYRAIKRENLFMPKEWSKHSRYETGKDRDKALKILQRKSFYGMTFYEYRNAS